MSFKICVIGCGGMSTLVHGDSFKKYAALNKDVELSACCDINIERAQKYKERFGFLNTYNDYIKMLDTEKPDAVSLISPVDKTKEMAVNIIKKGYPVIMEKPPGLNKEETLEIIKAAKEHNDFVKVAFNRRYTPLINEMKTLIKAENEKIYNINHNMIRYHRFEKDFSTTSIHAIDTVKYLAGSDYESVEFTYQHLPEHGDTVANIYMKCKFKNGIYANINLLVAAGAVMENIIVNCFENTFIINVPFVKSYDYPGRLVHLKRGEQVFEAVGNKNDKLYELSGFYNENMEFFEAVRNGSKGYTDDLENSLQSVILADCIRKRIKEINFSS